MKTVIETSQTDKQREERICSKDRISKTFGTISKGVINMYLKYLKENKRAEEIFEVMMAKNFSTLMLDPNPQIKKSQRKPSKINNNENTPRHILFKCRTKDKKKIMREFKGKCIFSIAEVIRITLQKIRIFSPESMPARIEVVKYFKCQKKKTPPPT